MMDDNFDRNCEKLAAFANSWLDDFLRDPLRHAFVLMPDRLSIYCRACKRQLGEHEVSLLRAARPDVVDYLEQTGR